MYPYLWEQPTASAGHVQYGTYGLMLVLAFLGAALVMGQRLKKVGVNPDLTVWLLFIAIPVAIVGARLMHFLGNPEDRAEFLSAPWVLFNFSKGGMAFLGGAIAATLAGVVFFKRKGAPVWKVADVAAPSIMLGLGIGRLGCFFAGCCHGREVGMPVSRDLTGDLFPGGTIATVDGFPWIVLVFHKGVGMGSIHETPVYPTQIWDSLQGFLLFGILSLLWKRFRRFDGQILGTLMVLYPVGRSIIETFRGDAVRGVGYLGFLTTAQVTSLALVPLGLILLAWRFRAGLAPEVEFKEPEDADID